MIPKLIKQAGDLQTKHRAICDGFLAQALQKTEKAEPFVEEAKTFYKALKKVKTVEELLTSSKYRNDLASACGFSDKARSQLTEEELNGAIKKVLTRIYKEAGSEFREERQEEMMRLIESYHLSNDSRDLRDVDLDRKKPRLKEGEKNNAPENKKQFRARTARKK